ncbi:MAG: hypothetical protein NWQ44_07270 [Flavobacteriales bacterium]|nr:hypothetical protein [Flavobacteriales bacterium]
MEQRKELNRTYIRIGLMFLAWGFMISLRAMIVIPEEPAPIVYEYHRPEKKIEKKVEQGDTLYLISSDWMFPYNFIDYNFPYYGCGGVIYMDQWGYPGFGSPSWGGDPLGGVVTLPGADSTSTDSLKTMNQDSLFNASIDSNTVNQMAQASINSSMKKGVVKRFFDKLSQMKSNRKTLRERRSGC